MKRFTAIISAAAMAAALFAQSDDMKFNPKQMEALAAACPKAPAVSPKKERKILIFSRTCGFRHKGGIPAAKEAFKNMGEKLGVWKVEISDDLSNLEPEKLAGFDCLVLNNTTAMCFGEPLQKMSAMPESERAKIRARSDRICKNIIEYVKNGGGLLAIHAAVDSYNYDAFRNREFTDMLGGEFTAHPWYLSNAPVTMVIDDPESPVIKDIWDMDAFKVQEEVYMLGSSYDRKKCRVLVRLDPSRSPFTTAAREANYKLRPDGDLATAYIKSFGKGRIAYTTFGHSDNNYYNPKFQELYMRLGQFCCGDLAADTSSIPFTGKSVVVPMDPKPALEKIRKLSDLKPGEPRDEEINGVLFAVFANNMDAKFRAKLEKFALSEIEAGKGTADYRAFLAELIWATGVSSDGNAQRLKKLASDKGLDESVRGKVSNALDHFNRDLPFYVKEKKLSVGGKLPADGAKLGRLINYLAKNPDVKIPEYLTFEALDDSGKARLAYALIERGESAAEALKFEPKSEAFAVAYAAALARDGKAGDLKTLLKAADCISPKMRPVAVGYLVSAKFKGLEKEILNLIPEAKTPAQSALIVDSLAKFDLSNLVSEIFTGFEGMPDDMKLSTLKTAESIANLGAFMEVAKRLPELDGKLAKAAIRTLLKCATSSYDKKMFAAILEIYPKCKKSVKENLVRFAAFDSSPEAIEFVKKAFSEGFRENAVKAFGEWRNHAAFGPLMAIAKSARDERARIFAQQSIAKVASICGIDAPTLAYMLRNSVRDEERASVVESAVKFPSLENADVFEKAGKRAEASKIRDAIKNAKPLYLSNCNQNSFYLALDGDINTRYTSGSPIKAGDWIAFDFGYSKRISEISFNLGSSKNDFPDEFSISAGASEAAAVKIPFKVERADGKVSVKFDPAVNARYIKITALKGKSFYWSVHELEIK